MGLHDKYRVTRTDGTSEPGGTHERCVYFVLDLDHDEHAIPAIRAYATSVRRENPELARHLTTIADYQPPRCGCREAMCPHSLAHAFMPATAGEKAAEIIVDQNKKATR